jgi:MFS family permease
MLARAVFGAVGSAASPAAQAYVADHTRAHERTREIAALNAAFALGSAIGPGVCALIASRAGLVTPIWLTAALAFAGAYAVWRFLPGGGPPAPEPAGSPAPARASASWRLARDRRVSRHLLYGAGLSLATGTLSQTYAFFVIDRLALSASAGAEQAAAGFMVGALASLGAQMGLVSRLTVRPRGLMAAGALIVAVGVGTQLWAQSLPGLMVAQMLQGLGFGLARSGFAGGASMAVSPREQGAAAGLVVAANGAGFVISPLTGGLAYQELGMTAPLWITAALMLMLAMFALRSRQIAAPSGQAVE